ncbi:hypothetical protein [Williamsia sp. 1135]|uniref:hypothetical protein n=1 Tax=Williamsia sp. 1135 TaxID=1889262 RepID=UPI001F0B49C1|nr:hypothetical protein [Williamsia sp. 1135]
MEERHDRDVAAGKRRDERQQHAIHHDDVLAVRRRHRVVDERIGGEHLQTAEDC